MGARPLSKRARNVLGDRKRLQALLDQGLTDEEIAHRLGINHATVYRWRVNKHRPPLRGFQDRRRVRRAKLIRQGRRRG